MDNLNRIIMLSVLAVSIFTVLAIDSDSDDSWRCGIFFASNPGVPPRAKIFVIPKKFPVDCSKPKPDIYNQTCHELMRKGLKEWNYEAPSKFRASSGKTIGDDLCSPIPRDIRRPGLELGFFYAFCGGEWTDTGLRKPEPLCCSQKKQVPC